MGGFKKLMIAIMAILPVCVAGAFFGCGGNENGERPSVGGETVEQTVYEFYGEKELYLKTSVTDYDFLSDAGVKDNKGNFYTPEIKSDNVVFGTAGSYEVRYEYKDLSFVRSVYVLGKPVISVASDAPSVIVYDDVQAKLFQGITAADSLGGKVNVGLAYGGEGSIYSHGIVVAGTHELEYFAVDKAGNYASVKRTVEIRAHADAPEITGGVSTDVADEFTYVNLNLHEQPVTVLKVEGEQVKFYPTAEGVRVKTADVLALTGKEGGELCAVTPKGAAFADITVKDEKAPELDVYGMNNFTYKVNDEGLLPAVGKKYSLQDFVMRYELFAPDGTKIDTDGVNFTANQTGDYSFTVIPVKNDVVAEEETRTLTLHVYDADTYDSIYANCTSLQRKDELPLISESEIYLNRGGHVEAGYCEDLGEGAYTFYSDRIQAWDGFSLGAGIDPKYKKITFDLYYKDEVALKHETAKTVYLSLVTGDKKHMLTGNADWRDVIKNPDATEQQLRDYTYGNYHDDMCVYKKDKNGEIVQYVNPHMASSEGKNTWLTVEISLESYRGASDRLYIVNEYAGRFYIKNVRYGTEEINKSSYDEEDARNSLNYGEFEGVGEAFKLDWPSLDVVNHYEILYSSRVKTYKKITFDVYFPSATYLSLYCGTATPENPYPNKVMWSVVTDDMKDSSNVRVKVLNGDREGAVTYLSADNPSQLGKWYRVEFLIPQDALYVRVKFDRLGGIVYIKNIKYSQETEFSKVSPADNDDTAVDKW